jgi:hypothetical protein
MPPQLKKLIPASDPLKAEDFRPDSPDKILRGRSGRLEIIPDTVRIRFGQGLPVDLSVRCEG